MLWRGVILLAVVVMIARLWQLQMIEGESYRIRADRNRFREVEVAAPRGVIYDRNGQILARNRPSFTIAVVPGDLPKTKEGEPDAAAESAVLDRLLALLAQEPPQMRPSPSAQPPLGTPTASPTPVIGAPGKTPSSRVITATLQIPDRKPWFMPRAKIEKAVRDGRLGGEPRIGQGGLLVALAQPGRQVL